jgi:hypothetical protein
MERIRDDSGRVIAIVLSDGDGFAIVYDARWKIIGFSNVNGTFDTRGQLVHPSPGQYGLLISECT